MAACDTVSHCARSSVLRTDFLSRQVVDRSQRLRWRLLRKLEAGGARVSPDVKRLALLDGGREHREALARRTFFERSRPLNAAACHSLEAIAGDLTVA